MEDDGVATRLQNIKTKRFRSERFGMRAWIVWATGLFAYIVAVLDRTTLGVSGLDAADRFSASPSVLSSFVVLQVIVYAAAQVPAGCCSTVRVQGADRRRCRSDGDRSTGAGADRVAARGHRGAGGRRARRRGHVHLGAAPGAALVPPGRCPC